MLVSNRPNALHFSCDQACGSDTPGGPAAEPGSRGRHNQPDSALPSLALMTEDARRTGHTRQRL
jgi:hypothetical protein